MSDPRGPYDRERAVLRALLRRARVDGGLRQADLAERLGVPQSFVSKVESGERRVDLVDLRRICAALNLPLGDLVAAFESALLE